MVSGDLQVFSLLPVMQMLLASGRSGQLTLSHARGGDLWFEGGELVHAQSGSLSGEAALQMLSSVDSGTFTFEADKSSPDRTIHLRPDTVMHRMLVNTDSWASAMKQFPDWSRPLRFSSRWNDQTPVTRNQYRALAGVGHGIPLETMLGQSELAPLEMLETLGSFVESGMVEVA